MHSIAALRMPQEAIGQALSQVIGSESATHVAWVRYSVPADFSAIWGALEDGDTLDAHLVVMLWDQTPDDPSFAPVATGNHLSPLEWAFCARKRCPTTKVLVLDLAPKSHSTLATYRFVQSLRNEALPWLCLVSLDGVSRCLSALMNLQGGTNDSAALTAEDLLRQVRLQLTETGHESNRHALTNIVGGISLAGSAYFAQYQGSIHTEPLLTLFSDASLLLRDEGPTNEPVTLPENTRLILVDDQASHGWFQWLRTRFRGCQIENLWNHETPHAELLSRIEAQAQHCRPPECPDIRFRMSLSNEPDNDVDEILLLDLRLFGDADRQDEAAFYRRLLKLAEMYQDRDDLPWPSFREAELSEIRRWCDAVDYEAKDDPEYGVERDVHHLALTLLPRLLALMDLAYPILVFSSTGQRRILESLRPYGNIVCDFSKPRFFGAAPLEMRQAAERELASAITKAQGINLARQKCRYLLSLHDEHEKRVQGYRRTHEQYDALYAELFIDETGTWNGPIEWVGGCFALWGATTEPGETPDGTLRRAQEKADQLNDELLREGVRYYDTEGLGPGGDCVFKKNQSCATAIAQARVSKDCCPIMLGALRLKTNTERPEGEASELVSPHCIDNRFRFALEKVIELYLMETIPVLRQVHGRDTCKVSTSVFPGTRILQTGASRDELVFRWGMNEHKNDADRLYSFDSNDVYPIIADVFERHPQAEPPHVLRGLAVRMVYGRKDVSDENGVTREMGERIQWIRCHSCNRRQWYQWYGEQKECTCKKCDWRPDYRVLHHVADEILRAGRFPDCTGSEYRCLFQFDTKLSGEFTEYPNNRKATLLASRALDSSRVVEAIASVPGAQPPLGSQSRPGAEYWVALRLGATLPAMSGADFVRLVQMMTGDALPVQRGTTSLC
jgi:hypothetical protein